MSRTLFFRRERSFPPVILPIDAGLESFLRSSESPPLVPPLIPRTFGSIVFRGVHRSIPRVFAWFFFLPVGGSCSANAVGHSSEPRWWVFAFVGVFCFGDKGGISGGEGGFLTRLSPHRAVSNHVLFPEITIFLKKKSVPFLSK